MHWTQNVSLSPDTQHGNNMMIPMCKTKNATLLINSKHPSPKKSIILYSTTCRSIFSKMPCDIVSLL